jgi:hypothetical protein
MGGTGCWVMLLMMIVLLILTKASHWEYIRCMK